MKKVLITILVLGVAGFAAVVYADNFMGGGIYSGANSNASAITASGAYARCPYTSTIPSNAPVQNITYNTPSYPVYPGPAYNTYNPNPTYPAYPTYPTYPTYQTPTYNYAPTYQTPIYPAPANPYAGYTNPIIYCPRGSQPDASLTSCIPVQIPPNAHLSIWGTTYDCNIGFHSFGNTCVPDQYTGY